MSSLFSPYQLKNITLKNRIVVSPMCQYSSEDGFANDWHLVHLGSRAVGGAALIITEATAVSPEGRISPQDLGIWKDEHIEKLRQITGFVEAQGAVPAIQLAHAGRKASTYPAWKGRGQVPLDQGGWKTLSASAIPFHENEDAPEELDQAGIEKVVADFVSGAGRAVSAGFKVIEIHAAHGYLVHQFLSPLSNLREDAYGGNFENRIRLLIEIVQGVKAKIGEDVPMVVRLSATDWADGGWDVEQSIRLSEILKNEGVDLIDVSSGGLAAHQKISVGPGYQVPFAERIKKEAGIPVGTVGLITNASQSEEILQSGQADLIVMARELLRNPYFPLSAARELGEDIHWPVQYERAKI
ncbi:NADPH dehydrogenase [Dyadobacter sp. CECT 9275]|uniref:NADPH dehydrogenase n=1 Tax=Dyadobacter helix TaxID=2822344 RepID=A0A916J9V1_9BACT|nr:NADPH dehydrogenase NamA [Dyadobacter sp. CECT 9275]CAG4993003.1 NADPH dehydrogenase [Dyadobacter sp. CECT 9275]